MHSPGNLSMYGLAAVSAIPQEVPATHLFALLEGIPVSEYRGLLPLCSLNLWQAGIWGVF